MRAQPARLMISTFLLAAAAATLSPQAPEMGELDRVYVDAANTIALTLDATSSTEATSSLSVVDPNGGYIIDLPGTAEIQILNDVYVLVVKDLEGVPLTWLQITSDTDENGNDRFRLPGVTDTDPNMGEVQNADCNRYSGVWCGWVRVGATGIPEGGGCPVSNGTSPTGVPTYPVSGSPPSSPGSIGAYPTRTVVVGGGAFQAVPALPNAGSTIKYPSSPNTLPRQAQADLADVSVHVTRIYDTGQDGTCINNGPSPHCQGSIRYRIEVTAPGNGAGLGGPTTSGLPAPNLQGSGPLTVPNTNPPKTPYPVTSGPTGSMTGIVLCGLSTVNPSGTITRTYDIIVAFHTCGERAHYSYEIHGNYNNKSKTGEGEPFHTTTAHKRLILTIWKQCNSCKK